MATDVQFVAYDVSSGWWHFVVLPDNTFAASAYAQVKDATLAVAVNAQPAGYPPGFTAADQQSLLTLMNKLAREQAKVALNAAAVTRVGQIYWDSEHVPAGAQAAEEEAA